MSTPAGEPARGPGRDSLTGMPEILRVPHDLQPLPAMRPAWIVAVVLALAATVFGVIAFYVQTRDGLIVTDHRNPGYGGAAWGLYIMFYVFFVGLSLAGITVAALARLFDIAALRPIARIAELMTIAAVVVGATAIFADLGRPLDGLLKLPRLANPRSPFYGTFTLVVAGYLFSSLVYFILDGRADAAAMARTAKPPLRWLYQAWASGYRDHPIDRGRHRRASYVLALTITPLLVIASSTLGFIFGIQAGRPGWYSALQAPAFVAMASLSGVAMLILVVAGLRRLCRLHDRIPDASLRWLGNLMWILAAVYLYFMVVEELTATYAGPAADRHVAHEVTSGAFAPVFWVTVGCLVVGFVIPFTLFLLRRIAVVPLVIAAALVVVAAVGKRLLIVVPSQTHGALTPLEAPLPVHPTWVELGVITGMFGVAALILLVFTRIFPVVPTPQHHLPRARPPRDRLRTVLTGATVLIAVALIAIGLADSFRLFSGHEIDLRIPYSPVLFATGVMLLFSAALVYEMFPARAADRDRAGEGA